MKRNISIITTALLLVLIPLSVYIALCFIAGLGILTVADFLKQGRNLEAENNLII